MPPARRPGRCGRGVLTRRLGRCQERLIDLHDLRGGDFVAYRAHQLLEGCLLLGDRMIHHGPDSRAAGGYVRPVLHRVGAAAERQRRLASLLRGLLEDGPPDAPLDVAV